MNFDTRIGGPAATSAGDSNSLALKVEIPELNRNADPNPYFSGNNGRTGARRLAAAFGIAGAVMGLLWLLF